MRIKQLGFFACLASLFGMQEATAQNLVNNEEETEQLRIMTYNVRNGRGEDNLTDYDRVAEVINEKEVQFVALQEVDSMTKRSNQLDVMQELAQRTDMYATFGPAIDFDGGKYGIGILSKEKPLSVRQIALPGREEKRTMLVVEFEQFVLANMHLSLTLKDREKSLDLILDEAERWEKPFFICGDWNDYPDSQVLKKIGKRFSLVNEEGSSIFVIVAVVLLFIFVKEKNSKVVNEDEKEKKEPILASLKAVVGEKEKSALFILLSLLCWFLAYQGILPFVGKYTLEVLGTSSGTAGLSAGMVGIAYAIFAVPSGKFAHKHGRKKTIRGALICIVIVMALLFCHATFTGGMNPTARLVSFWALLFCFGIFWVTVVTNCFPMLWQMADYQTVGIYTGLYYFFSQLASILAPPLSGSAIDLFGYRALFIYGLCFMLLAYFLMSRVHRGEPEDDAE